MTMTIRIKAKEDILAPGVAAGLLSTAALALCGKLHGKRASAPVSAVSHWLWPQEARRTARPKARHLIAGLLIHQTMSIGWAAFNALALAALRRALERGDGAANCAPASDVPTATGTAANDVRDNGRTDDDVRQKNGAERTHRIALAAATTVAAAVGDYIVVPKRFTPGFEYHLSAAYIAAVYVAFGAGLMVPFMVERWAASRCIEEHAA
jgi:hypothetical protein